MQQEKAIFEHLMLFDQVCFRVKGESLLIGVLSQMLGERGFNEFLEQQAITFALWDQDVVSGVENTPGLNALASVQLTSSVHSDAYSSIEEGLRRWKRAPEGRGRKKLVRKLLKSYSKPDKDLTSKAVRDVQKAAIDGRLEPFGILPVGAQLDSLTEGQKITIAKSARDYAEYGFLVKRGMTSFSEYKYFCPFWDTAKRFQQATSTVAGFAQIAEMEGLPNLRMLHGQVERPMERLATLRQSHNSREFRKWLSETTGESSDGSLVKAYVDEIANRKQLFESVPSQIASKIALATFGIGLGATIATGASPFISAAAETAGGAIGLISTSALKTVGEKIPDLVAEVGVELFDSFLIERIAKGWSPRMFVRELERLPRKKDPQ